MGWGLWEGRVGDKGGVGEFWWLDLRFRVFVVHFCGQNENGCEFIVYDDSFVDDKSNHVNILLKKIK